MTRNAVIGVFAGPVLVMLMGCSNPHKDAARAATEASKAEKDVSEQKAQILEDYRNCLKKNKSDEQACAGYKNALDSL
jgi:hypothetical protein